MSKKQNDAQNSGDEFRNIMLAVRDFVFQSHKFPQVNDIADITKIQRARCNEIVDQLIGQKQLYIAFEGAGLPRVILPYDMMQNVIMTQKRPPWIQKYEFAERGKLDSEIKRLTGENSKFDTLERLLYLTDIPLENAVAFTLDFLGFKSVVHQVDTKDYADIIFERESVLALVEVEGPTKQGDKTKILQLDGWVKVVMEKQGKDPDDIQGFFVVNHYREQDPDSRGDPLTDQARKFLKRYRFRFFTTYYLYKVAKDFLTGVISQREAQDKIWEGERIV